MSIVSAKHSVWRLNDALALYDDGRRKARVDLHHPGAGLHDWRTSGEAGSAARLLGVDLGEVAADELSLPESYARVDDLVATYRRTASRPFRLQAYWRHVELAAGGACGDVSAFDLEVSINTDLLDTRPTVDVVSTLGPATVVRAADERMLLVRPVDADWSYVEIAHPADDCATRIDARHGTTEVRRTLFGRFLEKGVIVRARLRGALVPRTHEEAAAGTLREALLSAPLPLTT